MTIFWDLIRVANDINQSEEILTSPSTFIVVHVVKFNENVDTTTSTKHENLASLSLKLLIFNIPGKDSFIFWRFK